MRKYLAIALVVIGFVTLLIWTISQYIQPILPATVNASSVLFFAALTSVVGAIAGFKDIIELVQMFAKSEYVNKDKPLNPTHTILSTSHISNAENVLFQTILSEPLKKLGDVSPVLHNLPQPSYSVFIGRQGELRRLIELLRPYPFSQDSRITINGIGGVGKTTLALEVAHRYLHSYNELASEERFTAIIWTSAKNKVLTADGIIPRDQQTQTIDDLLRQIADVLNLHFDADSTYESKLAMVRQLLSNERSLLIIDNYEEIDDPSILSFIQEIPAPTKLILTTRHKIDIGSIPIQLAGMPKDDGILLIDRECERKQVFID